MPQIPICKGFEACLFMILLSNTADTAQRTTKPAPGTTILESGYNYLSAVLAILSAVLAIFAFQ